MELKIYLSSALLMLSILGYGAARPGCVDIEEITEELESAFSGDGSRPRCPLMQMVSVTCSVNGNCFNQGRRRTVYSCDEPRTCLSETRCRSFREGSIQATCARPSSADDRGGHDSRGPTWRPLVPGPRITNPWSPDRDWNPDQWNRPKTDPEETTTMDTPEPTTDLETSTVDAPAETIQRTQTPSSNITDVSAVEEENEETSERDQSDPAAHKDSERVVIFSVLSALIVIILVLCLFIFLKFKGILQCNVNASTVCKDPSPSNPTYEATYQELPYQYVGVGTTSEQLPTAYQSLTVNPSKQHFYASTTGLEADSPEDLAVYGSTYVTPNDQKGLHINPTNLSSNSHHKLSTPQLSVENSEYADSNYESDYAPDYVDPAPGCYSEIEPQPLSYQEQNVSSRDNRTLQNRKLPNLPTE